MMLNQLVSDYDERLEIIWCAMLDQIVIGYDEWEKYQNMLWRNYLVRDIGLNCDWLWW